MLEVDQSRVRYNRTDSIDRHVMCQQDIKKNQVAVQIFEDIMGAYWKISDQMHPACSNYLSCRQHTCELLTNLAKSIQENPESAGEFYKDICDVLPTQEGEIKEMKEHLVNVAACTMLVAQEINSYNKSKGAGQQYDSEQIVEATQLALCRDYHTHKDASPELVALVSVVDKYLQGINLNDDKQFVAMMKTELGQEISIERPYQSLKRMFSA